MPDTIKTPLGAMKKNTAYMVGGGLVLIIGVVYVRSKKQAAAAAVANSGANTGIDPATGYPFGSAEDAAALANQGNYITPGGGGGGGGGPSYSGSTPGTFTSNSQWTQYVENYLISNGMVTDQVALGAALGRYLSGKPVTPEMVSLIEQAIAVGDKPPLAGTAGYPPSINTSPTVVPNPTPPTPPGGTGGPAMKTIHVNGGSWLKTILPAQWQHDYAPFFAANPGAKVVQANRNGFIGPNNPSNPNDPTLTWVFPYPQDVKVPA